jgi:transposase
LQVARLLGDPPPPLAQRMNQTQVIKLMRMAGETVGKILARVVAEKLDRGRLDGRSLIGVDEASYGADHKFLTCVADHETGGIVWATEGRNAASLHAFFDGLTDEQKASVRAVSIEMSAGAYALSAITEFSSELITRIPQVGSA